jgi:hypothetical protein
MAKQGERYNPKTKTGWKWEKGRSVYYKKGKKLNTRQHIGEALAPLVSGAKTIRDKLRIHPDSETGETVFRHNKKLDEAQDNYDDSADVAAYQKYEKGANEHNAEQKKIREHSDAIIAKKRKKNNTKEEEVPPEKSSRITGATMKVTDLVSKDDDGGKAAWLKKTRNSPAAKSKAFSDDERWAQQQKHRKWKEKRKNKKKLSIKD